jgi:hypothetical protein
MYWAVVSLDPLIVVYHDGYARIGNAEYTEGDFSSTTTHLTTHTGLGAESKGTFEQFEDMLNVFWEERSTMLKGSAPLEISFPAKTPVVRLFERKKAGLYAIFWIGVSYIFAFVVNQEHVRNQFKEALAEMMEVYHGETFTVPDGVELTSDNGFSFYCADFILDKDLDVWFIEPQAGCGLDEDYYFRLEMHAQLFNGMTDIMEEIWKKQEEGSPLLPLENLGNWQILYADGLIYRYKGYKRSTHKASCKANEKQKTRKKSTNKKKP